MWKLINIQSNTSKAIVSNTVFQLVGKLISMTITMLATILIARVYGRDGFGEFNLMQTWPAFVFIIVDFGLNAIAVREISKDPSKSETYLNNIFTLRVIFSTVLIVALAILLMFFPYATDLKFGIILSLFLILTQSLFATVNIIFQAKLRYDLSVITNLIGYLFILIAILLLAYFKYSVVWISFAYVIGGLLTFIVAVYFLRKLNIRMHLQFNKPLVDSLIKQSLPLGLMFVFSQINFKSDSLMLSVLHLPDSVGLTNTESIAIYGLPYKIFEVGLVLPTFIMNSVYPVFVMHMAESKERFKHTLYKVLGALVVAGILSSIIGIFMSPLAINIVGGAEFTQSILVLQILLSGLILYFLTQPLAWLIVTLDKQKYLPVVYLVSALFNVTANYIFIPRYSFYASSVITHISELINLLLLAWFARKAWKEKYD